MLGVLLRPPVPAGPLSFDEPRVCVTCKKPLQRATGERFSTFELRYTCSHVCRLRRLLTDGIWQRAFPGARHRDWSTVPALCDRGNGLFGTTCGGRWQVTETGVRCFRCGGDQVIAAVLVERLITATRRAERLGRPDRIIWRK